MGDLPYIITLLGQRKLKALTRLRRYYIVYQIMEYFILGGGLVCNSVPHYLITMILLFHISVFRTMMGEN